MSGRPADDPLTQQPAAWGTYAEKHERKLVGASHATPEQRLAWLEEVLHLALAAGALPRRRDGDE